MNFLFDHLSSFVKDPTALAASTSAEVVIQLESRAPATCSLDRFPASLEWVGETDYMLSRARTDLKLSWKLGDAEALLFNLQLRAGSPFGNMVVAQKKRGSRNLSKMWIL